MNIKMAVDLSSISYFLPLITFLVVFMICYAIIKKIKLFEKEIANIFVAFLISSVFISASGPASYVQNIIPWFAILVVSFVLLLAILGFVGVKSEEQVKWGRVFAMVLLALFVISGIFVFSSYFSPYLPWNNGYGANPDVKIASDWLFSPRVFGALILIAISALVSYALVRGVSDVASGKGK